MKLGKLVFIPLLCLVSACTGNSNSKYEPEEIKYYAFFMNNYPRVTVEAPSGFEERVDNTLFLRKEITPNATFTKPENDPTRENYEFQGWFKEKGCLNEWDFSVDTSPTSIYLYAKWGMSGTGEYMEPEYKYPEKIISDANFRVTGILNSPVSNGQVNLTTGGIARLENSISDVKFAINYERRESVSISSATYNPNEKSISISVSSGESFNIKVNDISSTKIVDNSNYEAKAQKYETLGATYENYHIALGGSSSMENWSTSTIDMAPIVTFNHGIGGTTVQQWTDCLFERLIAPYCPKAVAYYVGVNNIINGDHETGIATGEHLVELFDKTHQYLPNTQIFYVMINRLPGYGDKQSHFDDANNKAILYSNSHSYLRCIDAGQGLLKEDGLPNAAYFMSDGLHMSKYGYVIWGQAVKDAIIEWLDGK